MDYSRLSDFEVNQLVAVSRWPSCSTHSVGIAPPCVCALNKDGVNYSNFNPCNNPSDAWPILVENKIGGHWGKATPNLYFAVSRLEDHIVTDNNPLRAAMIVYLMMCDTVNQTDKGD